MRTRTSGQGRPRGSPNKTTAELRQVFVATFLELQKVKAANGSPPVALSDWAKANPGEFYKLVARLIPHEIVGSGGGPLIGKLEVSFVSPVVPPA